jgi:hypothetical protein
MSEAIWIELIKVLPAFLWIGFGFIALAVAKRIFTAQAPRMTKVETPWVTVELAQQAIEQAAVRGPEQDGARGVAPQIQPPVGPDWAALYPLPTQQVPAGTGFGQPAPPGGRTVNAATAPVGSPPQSPAVAEPAEEDEEFPTKPVSQPEDQLPDTPPINERTENANGPNQRDSQPPSPMTEPNLQVPNIPPTYPIIAAPPGGNGYYGQPIPPSRTTYYTAAQLPPYQQAPAYQQPAPSDSRSLRAATRLALAADELQGGALLWADDHHEWNEPLIRLFRTAGIIVDTVASSDEAMRALQKRSYDLVVTDMRREREPDGDAAGTRLLDRMIAAGIPTPAVVFSDHPSAHTALHPRAITATNSPEKLVDTVVDIVGDRRNQQSSTGAGWLGRLKGNQRLLTACQPERGLATLTLCRSSTHHDSP